jgi:four helix bundle protein
MNSYIDLEIYNSSLDLFFKVHSLSLLLPKYELYELGSQVRRSANSINSNIVEGFGRRRYKSEFVRFLIFAQASNDETISHLCKINKLYPDFEDHTSGLLESYNILGAQINKFIQYVETSWRT